MPSPFASAVTSSFTTLKNVAGETVTIRRGIDEAEITAVPGQTESDLETENQLTVKVRNRDFLIARSEYDFGDGAVEPEPSDQIELTLDGVLTTFEIFSPGQTRVWEWWDQGQTVYRIHTREI